MVVVGDRRQRTGSGRQQFGEDRHLKVLEEGLVDFCYTLEHDCTEVLGLQQLKAPIIGLLREQLRRFITNVHVGQTLTKECGTDGIKMVIHVIVDKRTS